MTKKRALSRISDTIADIPKPNLEDYEHGQVEIDEAEEKRAEEQLAAAKRKLTRQGRVTLALLSEVKAIRRSLTGKRTDRKLRAIG